MCTDRPFLFHQMRQTPPFFIWLSENSAPCLVQILLSGPRILTFFNGVLLWGLSSALTVQLSKIVYNLPFSTYFIFLVTICGRRWSQWPDCLFFCFLKFLFPFSRFSTIKGALQIFYPPLWKLKCWIFMPKTSPNKFCGISSW